MDISNQIGQSVAAYRTLAGGILQFVSDRFEDLADFISPDNAPPTQDIQPDYTPPFLGGQCSGVGYRIQVAVTYSDGVFYGTLVNGIIQQEPTPLSDLQMRATGKTVIGAISSVTFGTVQSNGKFVRVNGVENNGTSFGFAASRSFGTLPPLSISIFRVITASGADDNCGNLPNPNAPFSPDNGIVTAPNPDANRPIELLAPALPIVSVAALLAKLAGIANALKNIGDALEGLKKIGEALDALAKLLKALTDKEKEKEKKESDKRQCSVGQWTNLNTIDGFLSTAPININGKEAIAYAVEINAEKFPPTASRILGVKSPSISPLSRPLFYLMWQDVVFAVSGIREVQVLHSIHYLPEFCQGFFWNYRENPQLKLKARIYYQTEPEEEEEPTE